MLMLISKIDDRTKVLMTPMGVQIWQRGPTLPGVDNACSICHEKIDGQPFYVPVAGPVLLNPLDRIHQHCADQLDLLPMQTNPLIEAEEVPQHATD
jgi:hypothetical protein